ncbi:hypothetical protein BDV96DRAFT_310967 [Lophiotrema nucula]|uniref:Uncharacterized protein n=1 Tax=Lophiotrema nucula TaxID=690887 RepID=A0A6A5YL82_9PLEO|nr:hypothetical protein BDV96DRAFT_310967 [Lophiotrema nucula]
MPFLSLEMCPPLHLERDRSIHLPLAAALLLRDVEALWPMYLQKKRIYYHNLAHKHRKVLLDHRLKLPQQRTHRDPEVASAILCDSRCPSSCLRNSNRLWRSLCPITPMTSAALLQAPFLPGAMKTSSSQISRFGMSSRGHIQGGVQSRDPYSTGSGTPWFLSRRTELLHVISIHFRHSHVSLTTFPSFLV